jgi:hypothetical protein
MKYILSLIVIAVIAAGAWYVWSPAPDENIPETETETETNADRQVLWHNATTNDIRIDQPLPNVRVSRSFALIGTARGGWFFEASFPIEVQDANGNQLFESFVQAEGEWMTENFVPFSTTITVPGNYTGPARLILHRDNASGLPEHDKNVSIPIVVE